MGRNNFKISVISQKHFSVFSIKLFLPPWYLILNTCFCLSQEKHDVWREDSREDFFVVTASYNEANSLETNNKEICGIT